MTSHIKTLQLSFIGLVLLLNCFRAAAAEFSSPIVLVATERLAGSPYEQTVVLAVPSGDGNYLGLIANRPTAVKVDSVQTDSTSSRRVVEPVFFGGPVMSEALFAAIRAPNPPSPYSVSLMPGLFLVTDTATVERLMKTRSNARYFSGFAVWDAAQLGDEIRSGMWDVQPADPGVLFHANPQELWLQYARSKRHFVSN